MSLEAPKAKSIAPLTAECPRPPSRARDLGRLFASPVALFEELPTRPRPAPRSLMLVLVLAYAATGWAWTATGIPDYEIDAAIQREVARTSARHEGEESTSMLADELELVEKSAGFWKFLQRLRLWVARPLGVLAGILIIAGLMHGWVALVGGRPNYPLTLEVASLAAFVLVARAVFEVILSRALERSTIETSLAALLSDPRAAGLADYLLLRRLDPFVIWFWSLIALGLVHSLKLDKRPAIAGVVVLAVVEAAGATLVDAVRLVDFQELLTG